MESRKGPSSSRKRKPSSEVPRPSELKELHTTEGQNGSWTKMPSYRVLAASGRSKDPLVRPRDHKKAFHDLISSLGIR